MSKGALDPHLKRLDRIKIHIDRLTVGGRGIGRHDGMAVFVADTAPGDDAEVEITTVKKNFAEARLLKTLTPSPSRIQPPCPVAGICGGCTWQHLNYGEQLNQKRQIILDNLRRLSGFELTLEEVRPVVPSPKQLRYRNRIQLHRDGKKVGFFKRSSHEVIDIQDCLIADERLTREIKTIRNSEKFFSCRRVEVFLTPKGDVSVRPDDETNSDDAFFAQVNSDQNENLVAALTKSVSVIVQKMGSPMVYDLYAGSGNFTFPIASANPHARLIAAELNSENVRRANEAIRDQNSKYARNIDFRRADVGEFLESSDFGEECVVVLDPPRTGCAPDVLQSLTSTRLRPSHIFYVSCHPVTLARDLRALREAGYQIKQVQPFDMFPQTDHVETLVHLVDHEP